MKTLVSRFVGVASLAAFLAINLQAQRIHTAAGGFVNDDHAATNAALAAPQNVAFDSAGKMYISDTTNQLVRMVDTSGIISAFAGTGKAGSKHGEDVKATAADIRNSRGIVVDSPRRERMSVPVFAIAPTCTAGIRS